MDKLLQVSKLYEEDSKLKKDDVEMLQFWCKQQRHFPQEILELQVALALHACFYSMEQAKNCLENYFTIRGMCPELFANGNPEKNPGLKQSMNTSFVAILPTKTPENYAILMSKLIDTNPDVYNPQMDTKFIDMLLMQKVHCEGPNNGLAIIIDMKGSLFSHVTKLNLGEFKKFVVYLQTAMPIRLRAIHLINIVPFMDKVLALLKPFLNKEMFEKIHIHGNNSNLYKFVPKECLPSDYGGKTESVDSLHAKSKQLIYDYQWFYEFQDKMITDESKRIGPRKNADSLFGFDGTFRKLSVD